MVEEVERRYWPAIGCSLIVFLLRGRDGGVGEEEKNVVS